MIESQHSLAQRQWDPSVLPKIFLEGSALLPNTIFGRTQQEIQIVEEEARRMGLLQSDISLWDKCVEDWTQLSEIKLSCEEGADALQGVVLAARKLSRGRTFLLENVVMGRLLINSSLQRNENCPFDCNYQEDPLSQPSGEVVAVKNLYKGKEISFSNSTIHNLRRHGFSAGLDLKKMVSVLNLPRLDGFLQVKIDEIYEKHWEFLIGMSTNDAQFEEKQEEKVKRMAKGAYQIDAFAIAYVFDKIAPCVSNKLSNRERLQDHSQLFDWSQEQLQETLNAREQLPGWLIQVAFAPEEQENRCRVFNHQRDSRKISDLTIENASIDSSSVVGNDQSYYKLNTKLSKKVDDESLEEFINYYRYPPVSSQSKGLLTHL